MSVDRLILQEHRPTERVHLDSWQVDALRRAVPDLTIIPSTGLGEHFDLTPAATIGTIELGGWSVEIRPKIPIDRLLFLISFALDGASWQPNEVDYHSTDTLVDAMAPLFASQVARALGPGVLHGYRTEEDALHVIRGRIRFGDQLRRRFGDRLPVEVTYDEYSDDIAENQLLKSAIWRIGRFRLPARVAGALRRYDSLLDRVTLNRYMAPATPIGWNRLNQRYRPAVALARLILSAGSIDVGDATHRADGLLVNMNKVFEDFVLAALRKAMKLDATQLVQGAAGHRLHLDAGGRVGLSPDLSWWNAGECVFVGDAKYKRLTSTGIKHPDLYQLLAYLTATRLSTGVLIYPLTEAESVDHHVPGANAQLLVRSIDLGGAPSAILATVDALANELERRAGFRRAAA